MSTDDGSGSHTNTGKSRKRILQRIYRSIEAQDFSQLREIIEYITHESPQTRHDILLKATEIIRELAREYHSLLAEHQAALTSSNSTASPSTQHPGLHTTPAVQQFSFESWPVNHQHQHQMMPMHLYDIPWSNAGEIIHDTTQSADDATQTTTDDATQDYPYYTYQSE